MSGETRLGVEGWLQVRGGGRCGLLLPHWAGELFLREGLCRRGALPSFLVTPSTRR